MPNAINAANARTLPEATNRRAVLGAVLAAGVAAPSAARAAILSLAPARDPIFELIEAHRTAWARFLDIYCDMVGDKIPPELEAFHPVDIAEGKLLGTPPATPAGARAIIEYLIEIDEDCEPDRSMEYFATTLLRSPIFAIEEA
jgi:hypothetical protein